MKIIAANLFTYRLPLTQPLLLKNTTVKERRGCLIKLTADSGAVGWGETAPLPGFSTELLDHTVRQLITLKPALFGISFSIDLAKLSIIFKSWLGAYALAPSVQCGIEMAVLNTLAAHESYTLAEILSNRHTSIVRLNGLIAGDASAVAMARKLRLDGFDSVKLKIGRGSIADDIEHTRQVNLELGDEVALRLDANRAWTFDDASHFVEAITDCPIEYIEEPLADPSRLAEFYARTGLPVAIDESLIEMAPDDLRNHKYLAAIVLKPTLIGGFEKTITFARAAREMSIKVVISSTFESGIGIAALVHLAAAMNTPGVAAGLDTLRRFKYDVLSKSFEAERGSLDIAQVSRAACTVDESRLDRIEHD
jgi:o-succinylbenzoate synthase